MDYLIMIEKAAKLNNRMAFCNLANIMLSKREIYQNVPS